MVVSRGNNLRRMKWFVVDIWSSSSLRRKSFKYKILLNPELQETKTTMTVLQSNIHYNIDTQPDWIIHARAFQCWKEKQHRELIKTNNDVTVIKHTSQKHNYPQLDLPCPSVLIQSLQRDEKETDFH
jgi:hypothetical protein